MVRCPRCGKRSFSVLPDGRVKCSSCGAYIDPSVIERMKNRKRSIVSRNAVAVADVLLVPETWIIAPIITKQQLQHYYDMGWIDDDALNHLDRAFPRNSKGQPIILKHWLLSPMKTAIRMIGLDGEIQLVARKFNIVDDTGFPVDYIVIDKQPLRYRRVILNENKEPQSTEYFEYIDSTFRLRFKVSIYDKALAENFREIMEAAGKVGLMGRTARGFGKFRVEVSGL